MLSRVADSLYWMSRHLEHAEHTARLLRVMLDAAGEMPPESVAESWARVLASLHHPMPPGGVYDMMPTASALTFDRKNARSILACIAAARDNARQVREQISSEMWQELNGEYLSLTAGRDSPASREPTVELYIEIIESIHLLQGITDATMSHGEGWHFIQLGRFVERGQMIAGLLGCFYGPMSAEDGSERPAPGNLEWVSLLKMCTAFEAYCKVYTANIRPEMIAEFLVLDSEFPRSIRFAADMVQGELLAIAGGGRHAGRAERIAGRLRATLDYNQIDDITADGIAAFLDATREQLVRIHYAIYESYIDYPVDAHLAS